MGLKYTISPTTLFVAGMLYVLQRNLSAVDRSLCGRHKEFLREAHERTLDTVPEADRRGYDRVEVTVESTRRT